MPETLPPSGSLLLGLLWWAQVQLQKQEWVGAMNGNGRAYIQEQEPNAQAVIKMLIFWLSLFPPESERYTIYLKCGAVAKNDSCHIESSFSSKICLVAAGPSLPQERVFLEAPVQKERMEQQPQDLLRLSGPLCKGSTNLRLLPSDTQFSHKICKVLSSPWLEGAPDTRIPSLQAKPKPLFQARNKTARRFKSQPA